MGELTGKGQSVAMAPDALEQLMVTMEWTTEADFDLAALYEAPDGKLGMVYFNDKGDLNAHPHMQLSGDAGVGDTGGANKEVLTIMDVKPHAKIHLFVWDYGALDKGTPARFAGSDVKLTVMNQKAEEIAVTLDTGDMGNVCLLATIDNTGAIGAQLINQSKIDTLKGFPSDFATFKRIVDNP